MRTAEKPRVQELEEENVRLKRLARELGRELEDAQRKLALYESRLRKASLIGHAQELAGLRDDVSDLRSQVRGIRWHTSRLHRLLTGDDGSPEGEAEATLSS